MAKSKVDGQMTLISGLVLRPTQHISIKDLEQEELVDMEGNCVLIDPGCCYLIYCMHGNSESDLGKRMVFRYTSVQKTKETHSKRYRKILEKAKKEYEGGKVFRAEAQLSKILHHILDLHKSRRYVELHNRVFAVLRPFYEQYITPSSQQDPEMRTYPLHRKLRLSAFMNQQQVDNRLAKNMRAKFGANPVLVMGNWSAPNAKFHAPICGVGLRDMLRDHGFTVYLIDEFRTSITCPVCFNHLEKFQYVDNLHPWRCHDNPYVMCHELLRCNSQKCLEAVVKAVAENKSRIKSQGKGQDTGQCGSHGQGQEKGQEKEQV
ncbi:hypothetical protein GGF40_002658 [Coemansia sp. RSA 1286]|nr:hypothetical protein IWW45_003762 [Coemansia sp. RSA 485]KAJ2637002.1 hypothetical protein GGF40_002658 [Coemansia sp. RSA 1286]